MDNLLPGFHTLMTPMALFAVTAGVIGGVVIGALPGLTSTMGVALLIPLTFSMPPAAGLAMLGGIYLASTYSGSISAIVLNIPGTPAAVATLLDGYPMAQRGETTRALALATFGSGIGGILSVMALLLLAPPLAALSLRFGPPEYFLLALFGIIVIASLSAGALSKGLIAGATGLLLGTVGAHPVTGELRFSLGQAALYDGIPVVVALIGLYSIPEAIAMAGKPAGRVPKVAIAGYRGLLAGFGEVVARKTNVLRSALIGIAVGIVPGVGCSVGGFLSYDAARRAARKKHEADEFGTGAPDGVIASETANNAVTGGTLIPLLTLGIPGNPVTAVLLGGLMIHGLQPGADLFTVNADITYGFILSLLLANILFMPVGLVFARTCARIIAIPPAILAPCILAFAVTGAFSLRGAIDDILIMLAFGVTGFGCTVFSVPRAPLVLGLVLGTLAEGELARSLALVGGDVATFLLQLVTRPICIVLLLLCAFALYQGVMQHRRHAHRSDRALAHRAPAHRAPAHRAPAHRAPAHHTPVHHTGDEP